MTDGYFIYAARDLPIPQLSPHQLSYISTGRRDFLLKVREVILAISMLPGLANPEASQIFQEDSYAVRQATSSLSASLEAFEQAMDRLCATWLEAPEMPEAFFDLCSHFHQEVEAFTASLN